jgi:hypothetical protein
MGAGQFTCDSCGKTYAWKPQLAGKRVKCKCGSPLTVPRSDPAAHDGGLDDLAALAHGGDDYGAAPVAAGPRCPSCGEGVDASAVICINCGTNLKTGKRLATATVAAAPAGGRAGAAPAFDRPFGVKSLGEENKMSPQAKKILAGVLSFALITIIVVVVIITSNAKKKEAQRQAAMNAGPPPKLERMLIASEKSGGLTNALKDGTLYEEMSKGQPPPPPRPKWTKDGLNAMGEGLGHAMPMEEVREWLKTNADATLHGMSHDESVKLMNTLYDKYKVRWIQVGLKTPSDKTGEVLVITVPDWDKAIGGTADGPVRQEYWKWAEAFGKKINHEVPPDLQQHYMVFRLKQGGAGGKLASAMSDDEDEADAEADEDADDGDTPAKPANKKPRPGRGGAAKPGAPAAPAAPPGPIQ